MLKDFDTVKLIFGLKVQQLRREHDLSYQQLSERTGLAISYLHDIEKGKKYPKADKILALALAFGADYSYLVSLDAGDNRKLKPLLDLLHSDFLRLFPLNRFGIDTAKLIELLSRAPDRANAFLSTVVKIIRNYNLQGEDFFKAALRSYQDMHENYFLDLEEAVRRCKQSHGLAGVHTPGSGRLEAILFEVYRIRVDREQMAGQAPLRHLRSFYAPDARTLYLKAGLSDAQEKFLLAKELAFQCLGTEVRPYETRMLPTDSFDELLNNFRASYFAVALLMDEHRMVEDLRELAAWERWDGPRFLEFFNKYDVTPEMLLQRLANLLPRHFGIRDLFFLRFYAGPELDQFEMTKEMHLSQLHDPHAKPLDEHYCRRWVSVDIIRRLRESQTNGHPEAPIAGAQVSRYHGTPNAYLCLSVAKPGADDDTEHSSSVTIGLLVNEKLRGLFRFLSDPAIPVRDVHTTCERCPITDCLERAAPPVQLRRAEEEKEMRESLQVLRRAGIEVEE